MVWPSVYQSVVDITKGYILNRPFKTTILYQCTKNFKLKVRRRPFSKVRAEIEMEDRRDTHWQAAVHSALCALTSIVETKLSLFTNTSIMNQKHFSDHVCYPAYQFLGSFCVRNISVPGGQARLLLFLKLASHRLPSKATTS